MNLRGLLPLGKTIARPIEPIPALASTHKQKVMKCKNVFELCVDFLADLLGTGVATIADDDIWKLVEKLAIHRARPGDLLFRQGGSSNTAYLLVGGSVFGRVDYPDETRARTFTVEAKSILGEIGLLTGRPHSATIQACEDSQLLKLSRSAFITLLSLQPELPRLLAELALKRQNDDATYLDYLHSLSSLTPASKAGPLHNLLDFCRR